MKKWICLIFFMVIAFSALPSIAADEYELNTRNLPDGSIVVSFDLLVDPGLTELFIDNQHFSYFENLTKFNRSAKEGYPEILSKQVALSVEPNTEYTIEVVTSEYETYNLPSPYLVGRGTIIRGQNAIEIPYIIDETSLDLEKYPQKLIENEEYYLIRNISGFNFRFNVTEFNISQGTVKLYRHIEFILIPQNSEDEDITTERDTRITPEIYRILPRLFSNYEADSVTSTPSAARAYSSRSSAGDILVIYTARDESAIQPYITHKQSMGFNVSTEEVATGTNVKTIIQDAYDENQNIFYVQLVGDWEDIKSDLGTSQNAPMDPMLGCVAGDDSYPDLAVGRFSASSASQVTIQVDKTIAYEQNPGQPFWGNALGIGSGLGADSGAESGDDGEADFIHIDIIKQNKLLPNQYSSVGEIYQTGSASQVVDFVNSGTHLINYTGLGTANSWATSGFSSSNINGLTNSSTLPIIFSVANLNGTFHQDTCFAENWLQKSGGGAVAVIMSTINQPWLPPMRGQDYMNDLLTGGYNYEVQLGEGISTTSGRSTFGEIIVNAFTLMLTESSTADAFDTISTWTIFGDASLRVVDEVETGPQYDLVVNSGSGSGSFSTGELVGISAAEATSTELEFDRWVINAGSPVIEDINASDTTLMMPEGDASITATYETKIYSLIVADGNGDSGYAAGEEVTITATPPPIGYEFDAWSVEYGSPQINDVNATPTTLIMGSGNTRITASFKKIQYTLTVINGSGDGDYVYDESVTITADTAPDGYLFERWVVNEGSPEVSDIYAATTTLTMGYSDVTITATYRPVIPPTAYAGIDQEVFENGTGTLTAMGSSAGDFPITSYLWERTSGTVTLSDNNIPEPAFTAHSVGSEGEQSIFRLTVTDSEGYSGTDEVVISVINVNEPPSANAGIDQEVFEGAVVFLDGSGSSDTDGTIVSYSWTQKSGVDVELNNPLSASPDFVAPETNHQGTDLEFELTVTDNDGGVNTDTVVISVININETPSANAGVDQEVFEGAVVFLDGSGSSDIDGMIVSYSWTQKSGVDVELNNPLSASPDFVAPETNHQGTDLEFELTITDNAGGVTTDTVIVSIKNHEVETISTPYGDITIESYDADKIILSLADFNDFPQKNILMNYILNLSLEIEAGATVKITVSLPESVLSDLTWLSYDNISKWVDCSGFIEFNELRNQLTITLTDGESGDTDGPNNGTINFPSGIGKFIANSTESDPDNSSSQSSGGSSGGGCFINSLM